jgi:hypothetical protein
LPEIARLFVIMALDQRERHGLLMRASFSTAAVTNLVTGRIPTTVVARPLLVAEIRNR